MPEIFGDVNVAEFVKTKGFWHEGESVNIVNDIKLE
jgi:hypothetical protein